MKLGNRAGCCQGNAKIPRRHVTDDGSTSPDYMTSSPRAPPTTDLHKISRQSSTTTMPRRLTIMEAMAPRQCPPHQGESLRLSSKLDQPFKCKNSPPASCNTCLQSPPLDLRLVKWQTAPFSIEPDSLFYLIKRIWLVLSLKMIWRHWYPEP